MGRVMHGRSSRPAPWRSPRKPARAGLAAEERGSWRRAPADAVDDGAQATGTVAPAAGVEVGRSGDRLLRELEMALAAVVTRGTDKFGDAALRAELAVLSRARNRIDARVSTLMSELSQRSAARAAAARPDNPRAGEQAARQLRNEFVDDLKLTHGEVKQAQKLGPRLADAPATRAAFADGTLGARHAAVIADTLQHVADAEAAAMLEAELTAAAQRMNPVEFGKHARGRLIEIDEQAALDASRRREQRRTARLNLTEDGFQQLFVRLPGLAGETMATAVHAFRRHDAPGEHRTPEQATADAVVAMAEAALAHAAAPLQHGVRPHVIVTVDEASVRDGTGAAHTIWSGPVPVSEAARLFDDCSASRLVRDARGIPTEASEAVRSVPIGVWRGVVERDRVCIADGCDTPAQWCQVMHLETPYRLDGRLTIPTGALGCDYHHDRFDRRGWQITWIDGRPVLHHPDKPPRRPASRGDPP